MTDRDLPELLAEDEAATYLGITRVTLARLRRRGEIGCVVIAARRYRYTIEQLQDYVALRSISPIRKRRAQVRMQRSEPGAPPEIRPSSMSASRDSIFRAPVPRKAKTQPT